MAQQTWITEWVPGEYDTISRGDLWEQVMQLQRDAQGNRPAVQRHRGDMRMRAQAWAADVIGYSGRWPEEKIAGAIKQMLELTPHLKDRLTPGCATVALYRLGHIGSPPCGKYHNWPVSWVTVVTVNEEYPHEDFPEQNPRIDSIESQMCRSSDRGGYICPPPNLFLAPEKIQWLRQLAPCGVRVVHV